MIRNWCLSALLLAGSLPVRAAGPATAQLPPPPSTAPAAEVAKPAKPAKPANARKPVSKPRKPRPKRYSKASMAAFQPDPAQLVPKADAVPGPAATAATLLSPVVQKRPAEHGAHADPLPIPDSNEGSLAKLMDTADKARPSGKTRQLPAQEEGLALARTTAVPEPGETSGGVSDEAQAKVETGVDTGPMNLRVKKQALQMSVEIPIDAP